MALYRVRTLFTGRTGAPWVNTLFFDTNGGTAAQAANAAGQFWQAVDSKMDNTVTWTQESEVATVNSSTGQLEGITGITPLTGAGGVDAAVLPRATQALVRCRTGTFSGGRELRGRIFVPGITESDNDDDGTPSVTVRGVIDAAAADLIAEADADWVIWGRKAGIFAEVVAASTWTEWAVLRSRRD